MLHGYRTFVETTRAYIEEGIEIEKAVSMSIDECISQGILSDFFRNRRREIEKVAALDFTFERREKLIARDNYEDGRNAGIEEGKREGIEEGKREGIEEGIKGERMELIIKKVKKGMKLEEIADILEKPSEEIRDIYEVVMKNAPEYDIEKIKDELR